jgi:predicted Zn-dependent protease
MFKSGEKFERQRAAAEGREPRLYHGVFSSHPSPDQRAVQAAKGAGNVKGDAPPVGWLVRHDEYLNTINGIAYGSSKAQGIVRDNRFYHADMGITMAFPRGWTIDNLRDRLIAYTPKKDNVMQVIVDRKPEKQAPREFLMSKLKGASVFKGEPLTVDGNDGYSIITRNGSPIDNGLGPVRWAVVYRGESAYLFAGASRSAMNGIPEADGLIMASLSTLRGLKPSEFPLAEPYRLKVVKATDKTRLSDYASDMPEDKFKKETLELINAMYPNRAPKPGELFKIVE